MKFQTFDGGKNLLVCENGREIDIDWLKEEQENKMNVCSSKKTCYE